MWSCSAFLFRHVQYNDLSNRVFGWSMDDAPKEHKKKTTLLMYFAQYMDEHLIHGGDMLVKKDERQTLPPAIFMKKWFRTNRAIVMYLNNGTLQVMILCVQKLSSSWSFLLHVYWTTNDCRYIFCRWISSKITQRWLCRRMVRIT